MTFFAFVLFVLPYLPGDLPGEFFFAFVLFVLPFLPGDLSGDFFNQIYDKKFARRPS